MFSVISIAISSIAQAEGWYGGVGFGNSKIKDDTFCSDASSLFDPGSSCSSDDTDTGWKVFIGNQFNKNAAIEFGYIDLGKSTGSVSGTVLGIPATANADGEAKGFNLALVGSLPVSNEFSVLGRIGLFRWDVDVSASANVGGFPGSASDSASGTDLTFGVGAQYDFSKSAGVRVEWETFQDVGDQDSTGQSDIELLSLSLVFRFQ
jgi:OOP family OmpA-OmpF porin